MPLRHFWLTSVLALALAPLAAVGAGEGRPRPVVCFAPAPTTLTAFRSPQRGEAGPPSIADDTWAAGALRFRMLTGKDPAPSGYETEDDVGTAGIDDPLVTPTKMTMPRRTSIGVDYNRVSLLIAVLEKRIGMHLMGMDVFVNVVGGLKIDEPAVDLGIIAAVASGFREKSIDANTVVMGEVGLAGEVRAISQAELRLKDAAKLGFTRCVLPAVNVEKLEKTSGIAKMQLMGVRTVDEAMERLF